MPETHLRIHLNDTSRGVKDDYLLISGGSLEPVKAAVVITKFSAHVQLNENQLNEKIFMLTRKLEAGLSINIESQSILMRELPNATYGNVLELLVNNRIGSYCFPTSEFMQSTKNNSSMGVSRFITKKNIMIEFALIIERPENIEKSKFVEYARSEMDKFWSGLEF